MSQNFFGFIRRGIVDNNHFSFAEIDFLSQRVETLERELRFVEDGDDDGIFESGRLEKQVRVSQRRVSASCQVHGTAPALPTRIRRLAAEQRLYRCQHRRRGGVDDSRREALKRGDTGSPATTAAKQSSQKKFGGKRQVVLEDFL